MVTKLVNDKSYQSRLTIDVMMANYRHSIQQCHFDAMVLVGDMCTPPPPQKKKKKKKKKKPARS